MTTRHRTDEPPMPGETPEVLEPKRACGILLHPTSLPGRYGIGELGPEARAFVDALAQMGQRLWQVLPLGPTGYGDSPYQSLSTFAGNPLLISLEDLARDGLVTTTQLKRFPAFPEERVDYGRVIPAREEVFGAVCRNFRRRAPADLQAEGEAFGEQHADWLEDYALYAAIKRAHGGRSWTEWPSPLAARDPSALREARRTYRTAIRNAKILQFLFLRQWRALRRHCRKRGVHVVGDIPIFVAHDSADVWAHRELFSLNEDGRPHIVAGVPPDYFSATGQRWGNPLYRWDVHAADGFRWWIERMRQAFALADIVRIDHFRGFEAYWEIPGSEPTAVRGRWAPGPGEAIFHALRGALGRLPIIAEDLGVITPPVEALRDRFGFPGMKVLQFAFGNDPKAADYRPENFAVNSVCYTGTHDNDTTVGWFASRAGEGSTRTPEEVEAERRQVLDYLGTDGAEIHWELIGAAVASASNWAIFPLQDVLGLGSEGRMNVPGRPGGNWQWRFCREALTPPIRRRLREVCAAAGRAG